jgi:hypothetical protein
MASCNPFSDDSFWGFLRPPRERSVFGLPGRGLFDLLRPPLESSVFGRRPARGLFDLRLLILFLKEPGDIDLASIWKILSGFLVSLPRWEGPGVLVLSPLLDSSPSSSDPGRGLVSLVFFSFLRFFFVSSGAISCSLSNN